MEEFKFYNITFNTIKSFMEFDEGCYKESEIIKKLLNYEKENGIIRFDFLIDIETDVLQSFNMDTSVLPYSKCRIEKINVDKTRKELTEEYYENEIKISREKEKYTIYPFEHNITPSKDYPFLIYLYGCDDSSYSKVFSSEKEVKAFLSLISDEKIICTKTLVEQLKFTFTN